MPNVDFGHVPWHRQLQRDVPRTMRKNSSFIIGSLTGTFLDPSRSNRPRNPILDPSAKSTTQLASTPITQLNLPVTVQLVCPIYVEKPDDSSFSWRPSWHGSRRVDPHSAT